MACHLPSATAVNLHGQIYSYGPGTLCRGISETSHGPLTDMYFTTHVSISVFCPPLPTGEEISHTALPALQTHSLSVSFELPVADLTYVPLPLLLCHCTCRKRWHIANSSGGNLCLDATDDQCCAHNPMLTTFCQYSILGFKHIVLLGT